ncbi:MAG: carboxy-S-adenosyl-L-methionine synthase CmoA [Actinobacteria bacterium]|nr:carboxy-S-adenosyl-L-methionine synthase CmoA [Actinomycetota bacterium]
MHEDKIFSEKREISDFKFDKEVACVFDDMLERSVPFYPEIQRMAVELAGKFAIAGSNIYDLGCSTGTTMLGILNTNHSKKVKIIGIDHSHPMIDLAKKKLKENYNGDNYEFVFADLNKPVVIEKASVVIMLLTLQFIRPLQREILIKHIYDNLLDNGCLVIIEKVLATDSLLNRLFIDLYHKFKKIKGYSDLEIAQKREALENVLIPLRIDENVELLRRNGFPIIDIFFKWYNFAGFIGVKQKYEV